MRPIKKASIVRQDALTVRSAAWLQASWESQSYVVKPRARIAHAGDVMNTATIASLEQMHEDINFEISCGDTTVNQVQGEMLINSLATDLSNVDERLGLILRLSDQGYSPKDIAEELSIKTSTLYYCLKRIQRIARELGYIS